MKNTIAANHIAPLETGLVRCVGELDVALNAEGVPRGWVKPAARYTSVPDRRTEAPATPAAAPARNAAQPSADVMLSDTERKACALLGIAPDSYLAGRNAAFEDMAAQGIPPAKEPASNAAAFGLSDVELAMCESMGIKPEAFARTKKESADELREMGE